MKKDIRERLRAEVLLADGAMGTLLVSRGAPAEGPRSPNALTAPELVREIHDDYVAAGAQLLSTNTWDANRSKLSRFDWADSLEKINREAVRLARAAAAGEYVYVAGAVGPLGQLVKPYGPLTRLHVRELFTEQIRILLEEGVDLLSFETFSSTLEAAEALRAARALSAEIPIVASMTFLADGKTSFGEDVEDALSTLVAAGADVVGINCTVGPQEAFEIFGRAAGSVSVPISVRPNAGYPWVVSGRTVYPATPDYFRQSARDLLHAGAALVGGCCGTAPEHVAAMAREALGKARSTPAPPTRAVFVEDRSARPRRDRRSRAPEGRRRLGRGGRRPYPARPRRGRDQHHRQPDGAPPDVVHRRRASHPHGNGCRDDLPLLAAPRRSDWMPRTFRSRGEQWKIVSAPVSVRMRCATAMDDIRRRAIGLSVMLIASTPRARRVRAPSTAAEASTPFGGSTSAVTTRARGSVSLRFRADVSSEASRGRAERSSTKTARVGGAGVLRALPRASRAMAATCPGAVPQQPPTSAAPAWRRSRALWRK